MPPRDDRTRQIVGVLATILLLNLVVAAAKLLYGRSSGAIAVTADGLHSLLDAASNVIGLIAVVLARRPADDNHPYGHRKFETVAALVVAMFMFLGCWELLGAAWDRWQAPIAPRVTLAGYAVLLSTLAVNLAVAVLERRAGQRLQSEMLVADAAHTQSDVLATLVVLASFVAAHFGLAWADLAAALIVVVLILRAGFEILQGTLSVLSDERRVEPALVEREALAEPGVLEVHDVRSRGPLDDIHVDLHVLVDPATPIDAAHAIGHRVEARLRAEWPGFTDVVVHVEPALEQERARARTGGGLRSGDAR